MNVCIILYSSKKQENQTDIDSQWDDIDNMISIIIIMVTTFFFKKRFKDFKMILKSILFFTFTFIPFLLFIIVSSIPLLQNL